MSTTNDSPIPTTTHDVDQRAWIDGMRSLLNFLEAHPEVPVRHPETVVGNVNRYGDDDERPTAAEALARIARLPGRWEKASTDDTIDIRRMFGPHKLIVFANHSEVCERVVTTETVTREVPDPDALAKVPTVTVTEEVERVEWICPESILAAEAGR